MARTVTLNRNQIARFVGNDQEAIRAIEQLFIVAGDEVPVEVEGLQQAILDNTLALGAAETKAETALAKSTFDYIDLNPNAPHFHRKARFSWHQTEQTAEIGMEYDVVQQIGLEYFARVENATGVTIPKGTAVGFAGVGPGNVLSVSPYLADGTQSSLFILGIMAHDLPNAGQIGYCKVFGRLRDIDTSAFAVGDLLYASPTVAGGLTNVKPTAPDNVIPVAAVLASDATAGQIFVRITVEQMQYYGVFAKSTDQAPAAINTAYPLTFDATQISNGVTIGTPTSRIVVPDSGLYLLSAQVQLSSGSAAKKNVWVFFRKNGTDIASSARIVTTDLNVGFIPVALTETVSLAANDYIEVGFAADDTDVLVDAVAATAFAPAAPSVLLEVTQIQQ